jgi:hypothetical protein
MGSPHFIGISIAQRGKFVNPPFVETRENETTGG